LGAEEANEVQRNQLSGVDKEVNIGDGVRETIFDRRQ